MPTPLSTREKAGRRMPGLVVFRGFPVGPAGEEACRAVWLVAGGEPLTAARWFAAALRSEARPAQFAAACLGVRSFPWRPVPEPKGELDLDAVQPWVYRYRVGLGGRDRSHLGVQCWRWYGANLGWQRRCGPLSLDRFLVHFGAWEAQGVLLRPAPACPESLRNGPAPF